MATDFLSPTLPGLAANAVVAITSADLFAVWIKPLFLYLGAEGKAVRDGFLAWLSCLPEALGKSLVSSRSSIPTVGGPCSGTRWSGTPDILHWSPHYTHTTQTN